MADRGYNMESFLRKTGESSCQVVIPYKILRDYGRYLYKFRQVVGNAFLHLKRWRGVVTRYAKRCASFLAVVQVRCIISLWVNII